jgi:hypothetical protein
MNETKIESFGKNIPLPGEKSVPSSPRNENNRLFNLIWLILYIIFIVPSVYFVIEIAKSHTTTDFPIHPIVFVPMAIIVCLFLVIPKRNKFFTLSIFIIIGVISNVVFAKFYDLTWLFYPEFIGFRTIDSTAAWWITFGSWGVSFLIVSIALYIFMSSLLRLLFKKSRVLLCFLLSLLFTCITAYIFFYLMPLSLTFPKTELNTELDNSINVEILNPKVPSNEPKQVTSVESATHFFIQATGLSKGYRYGIRMLDPNQTVIEEASTFYYCRTFDCEYELGQANSIGERLNPGIYTVQIIAQKGSSMTIVAEKEIEITELIISPYMANTEYPCKLWLELDESSDKLLLVKIDDGQKMTNIGVWAQCDSGKTYDAQVEVGAINNTTLYYSKVIPESGEPTLIINLGGNVTYGLVRLIIDNQAMGEAYIDRG